MGQHNWVEALAKYIKDLAKLYVAGLIIGGVIIVFSIIHNHSLGLQIGVITLLWGILFRIVHFGIKPFFPLDEKGEDKVKRGKFWPMFWYCIRATIRLVAYLITFYLYFYAINYIIRIHLPF